MTALIEAIARASDDAAILNSCINMSTTKSKFFRVAVEGATTDGRVIERAWLEQMSKNFDPAKYGARIWMEHMRGMYPDSAFRAYGDVTALKTEEFSIDGQKRLALMAEIKPLPELVAMSKAGQKIYTSIEINPKFGSSGEAYLVGLGVTDSPASLGTEVLEFAAKNPAANPFTKRKQAADNMFSAAVEVTLEFETTDEDTGKFSAALKGIKDTLAKFSGKSQRSDDTTGQILEVVTDMADGMGQLNEQHSANAKALSTLQQSFATLQTEHKDLKAKFDTIDTSDAGKHSQRPPATGNNGKAALTDC